MKAQQLVFPDKDQCIVEDIELDTVPPSRHVLIENEHSLVSAGTELAMFTRTHRGFDEPDFGYAKYPFVPGYAGYGTVTAIADDVTEFKPGDTVLHTGVHATSCMVDIDFGCWKVDPAIDGPHALFTMLAKISVGAPLLKPVTFGSPVVVVGAGIIGNFCAQLYKLSGAGITAIADISPARLAMARDCGIDAVYDLSEKPLKDWCGELDPAIMVEAVGIPATIDAALKAAPINSAVILLGSPRVNMEIDPYFDIHAKGIQVIGAHVGRIDPADIDRAFQQILRYIGEGRLLIDPLLTHTMPFTDGLKAYEGLRDQKDEFMGVVLEY